jgi:AAA15 family ATPase/GTPase
VRYKKELVALIKTADIDIEDILINEDNIITTKHKKYNSRGEIIGDEIFDLIEESTGTKKIFALSAYIIDTLQNGKILVIDEMEANLHPILTQNLIKLFNDEINQKNAQLIFTTHDTNLLKPYIFRRDQIWFSEKNKFSSTEIYSLVEFKGVRASDDFEKQYIQGKYGAIPYMGEFKF